MRHDETKAGRASRGKRLVKIGLAVALTLVLVGAALLLLVDPSAIAQRVTDRALPGISRDLGRPVTIERVEASLFPVPEARVFGLRVGPEEGSTGAAARPLLEAERVGVRVRIWPLLKSLGKEIEFSSATVHDYELNLVRGRDGRWKLPEQPQQEPSQRELRVAEARLRGGTVRIVDAAAPGGQSTVALRDLAIDARELGTPSPAVEFGGALASDTKNLEGAFTTRPGAQGRLAVVGSASLRRVSVEALRGFLPPGLAATVTQGRVDLETEVSTRPDGVYEVQGRVRTHELALRGHPASGRLRLVAAVDPARPEAATVRIEEAELEGPGVDLGGTAQVTLQPLRARFSVQGAMLDLDTLLGVLPPEQAEPSAAGGPLPPSMRRQLQAAVVEGKVAIDKVVNQRLTAERLSADVALEGGVLRVRQASANLYGGTLRADGSSINLAAAEPRWSLRTRLDSVDLAGASQQLTGTSALLGKLSGGLRLDGVGSEWARMRSTLEGKGDVTIADGKLTSVDLARQLAQPLQQAQRLVGAQAQLPQVGDGTTVLRDLHASFTVKDGLIQLRRPLEFQGPVGTVRLTGAIGLDQRLQLAGQAQVAPEFVAQVAPGGYQPGGPVALPLDVGGTLLAPRVGVASPAEVAKALIASGPAGKAGGQLEDEARRRAGRRLRDFFSP